jgi:hypothetical protein
MRAKIKVPRINGRRGAFQLIFSALYLAVGISFLVIPTAASRADALRWLTDLLPLWPFASIWIVAALTGAVSAFLCRPRDWVGFFALTLAPAAWGSLFLIGVIFAGAPALGVITTAIYWTFAAGFLIASGMQGPNDRDRRTVVL